MIRKNVDLYFRLFEHYARLDRSRAISLAKRYLPVIQGFDPAIVEEMRGIAEGSGFEFEEILALNARTELMFPESLAGGGECTSMVALAEATAGGDVLIGQNWDWKPDLIDSSVLLEIEQEGRPNVVTLTEAGMVGKIGLNSGGIGACLNFLKSAVEAVGVPMHVMMRGILNSGHMSDAIRRIVGQDRGSSANCLVAHRDGAALDFETAPRLWDFIHPEKGVIVHSNHFHSERLRPIDTNVNLFPDSLVRFGRARQKMMDRAGKITVEDFKEVFRDHVNYPSSICRHPDERDPEAEHFQTVASIIMNLTTREVHIAAGPPCRNEYQTMKFKSLQ
jgi:isopenicillin-N N-acyltransferase-like protein